MMETDRNKLRTLSLAISVCETGLFPFKPSLTPEAGELVGARLMRALHIPCPEEVRVGVGPEEALRLYETGKWVCKTHFQGEGRLRAASLIEPDNSNVLIKKIPNAISLFSLDKFFGLRSKTDVLKHASVDKDFRQSAAWWIDFISTGHENFYIVPDFQLPEDTSTIQQAIQWDSPQMLGIHAGRIFLGCSAAHGGNLLVDSDGRLYSIDHESCQRFDTGEDLAGLFDNIRQNTRAWRALAGVAALNEQNIADILSGLPDDCWPLGSHAATVEYFQTRLRYWQRRYEQSTTAKCADEVKT